DDEICTGDHSCIRLSGCPSLTVKPNPDPLRTDPVATVIQSSVGCGLCGEVAHAAVLCPSFYRTDVISNPNWWDRALFRLRSSVISALGRGTSSPSPQRGEAQAASGYRSLGEERRCEASATVRGLGPLGDSPKDSRTPSSQPS